MTIAHTMLDLLSGDDWRTFEKFIPNLREPDLIIGGRVDPYLYRWCLAPRNDVANVYFHVQVRDDSDRGLHDHPYDNQSVILAGGYIEAIQKNPDHQGPVETFVRKPGHTIHRRAEWAHRLTMAPGVAYSMSLFATGPRVRPWGFWVPDGPAGVPVWEPYEAMVDLSEGESVFKAKKEALEHV